MRRDFQRLMMGSTHQTIYLPDALTFKVPLPPPEEQAAIASRVGAHSTSLQEQEAAVRQQVELLREYRKSLITAAVTGQLPIPEEAA